MVVPDMSERSLKQLMSLEGRVAVVTGGAAGIGAAICRRLAEAGAHVVVSDLDGAAAQRVAATISASLSAESATLDIGDADAVNAVARNVASRQGRLDIWVNNAGIYPNQPLEKLTIEQWDRVVQVNLRGTFAGCQAAGHEMIASGNGGVIINLSSINGYRAFGPGIAHYTSTKHAIIGLTKSIALEYGRFGIRALALAPTMVETEGTHALLNELSGSGAGDAIAAMGAGHPLGRVALPDDVARVAVFAASDLSLYMTGSTLTVDGGFLAV